MGITEDYEEYMHERMNKEGRREWNRYDDRGNYNSKKKPKEDTGKEEINKHIEKMEKT